MFIRDDWKLFRNLDTLCQKAGVNRKLIPQLIVKELVDNALDVSNCELKALPDNGFSVRDFGNGFEKKVLKDLFCINRPMVTTKLLRLPTRGALGNGLRVVVGAIISTNGKLFVETKGKKYEVIFLDDGTADVKTISESEIVKGTRFSVYLGNIFTVDESDFAWGKNAILMSQGKDCKCKTSAWWYTSEAFYELLNSYDDTLGKFLLLFDGIKKDKVDSFPELNVPTSLFTFEQSEIILQSIRSLSKFVGPKKLGGLTNFDSGLGEYAKKDGVFIVKSAKGRFDASIPYVVETWMRIQDKYVPGIYVNKTNITGEYSYWYDKGTMKLYRLGLNIDVKAKPSQMVINVTTPYMPITSDGKAPDFSAMNDTIQSCLNLSKTRAKKLAAEETGIEGTKEKNIIFAYMQDAIDKASGYGQYQFSQRQLYYAIRPYVMNRLDKQPEYTYFCKLLTDYENYYGEIDNLYRDPRGTLYHPHLREEISLGTIAVKNYERPEWTFNKILYCEKEGFFPILKDAKFPERFDCALLTSKGYASRAVKDLFDLLGETDEEILFFCIHDADSAGTMIYQTLQEATLTRKARKVKVINLGLDPWEAEDMDLEVETFESKSRRPVADYVRDESWRYTDWLQSKRVELNAMTTPQFLEWIEKKVSEWDNGKVIPDRFTIREYLDKQAERIVRERVAKEILTNGGYERLVQEEIEKLSTVISLQDKMLKNVVGTQLKENPERNWKDSVNDIAETIAR